MSTDRINHGFAPVYNEASKILILGSFPSPKSREVGFYYSHPQNRFWKTVSVVLAQNMPCTIEEKKMFLIRNNIGMWDVLKSCKIKNADDNSITEPEVNDFSDIFNVSNIEAVFTTGRKATSLYEKYCVNEKNEMNAIYLPSTSPANCRLSEDKLIEYYGIILKYIHYPSAERRV